MLSLDTKNIAKVEEDQKMIIEDYPEIPHILERCEDWSYIMRRRAQEIVPGLFLGPYSAASKSNLTYLMELGITHIVCVRQNIESQFIKTNFPNQFKYLKLDIADSATANIIQHFRTVKNFIDEGLKNGKVLVHGNAGISRSAALVLAYIMETYGLSQSKAYHLVQHRRFCINPNEGFIAQLKEFEPIYKAEKALLKGQSSAKQSCKRKMDSDIVLDNGQMEAMDS